MPELSIMMPVYNAERFVTEAIESILAQTLTDFEFIIVNDGSTDSSPQILERYAQEDQRIRLVNQPNQGVVGARQTALDLVTTSYVAVTDADDVSIPDRLEKQFGYLSDHEECVLVCGHMREIDPEGVFVRDITDELDHARIDQMLMLLNNPIGHSTAMMRTSVVRQVGGYRDPYPTAEDYDLWLRLMEVGRVAVLNHVVIKRRLVDTGLTYSQSQTQRESGEAALADACRRRGVTVPQLDAPNLSRIPLRCQWAVAARTAGNRSGARTLAWKALRAHPMSLTAWRVFAGCIVRQERM